MASVSALDRRAFFVVAAGSAALAGTPAAAQPAASDLVGVLLTQRLMESPKVFVDFWTQAYAAIDD